MRTKKHSVRIEEITDPTSPHIGGMSNVLTSLFPGYTPAFTQIIGDQYDSDGNVTKQIFVGLSEDAVAGLLQVFYRVWRGGLVAVVDLVGVLKPYRASGLGPRMMRHAFTATRQAAARRDLPPLGLLWLTEQDHGPEDSWVVRRVRMYERMGAQARRDLVYQFDGSVETDGEIILWYPFSPDLHDVSTQELAWILWQSGGLPEDEFTRRYGRLKDVEQSHAEATSKTAPFQGTASEASDA